LQIFMGAPVLIDSKHSDPLEIALEEMKLGVIPITVKRDGKR
jgi:DNA-directed RNA polymerase subunit K